MSQNQLAMPLRYLLLTITFLLVAITVTLFETNPRYEVISEEMLANGDFSNGLDGWQTTVGADVVVAGGSLKLSSHTMDARVQVWQSFPAPEPGGQYLIRGELRVESLSPGIRSWEKARLMIYNQVGDSVNKYPINVAALSLSRDWVTYRRAIEFGSKPRPTRIVLEILNAKGTLLARNLSLTKIRQRQPYNWIFYSTLTLWIVLGLGVARVLYQNPGRPVSRCLSWPLAAIMAIGLLVPESLKISVLIYFNQLWPFSICQLTHAPGLDASLLHYVTDWAGREIAGHFFAFLAFAVVVRYKFPSARLMDMFLVFLAVAASSETIQFFAEGRSPQLQDIAADLVGMACGLFAYRIFLVNRTHTF